LPLSSVELPKCKRNLFFLVSFFPFFSFVSLSSLSFFLSFVFSFFSFFCLLLLLPISSSIPLFLFFFSSPLSLFLSFFTYFLFSLRYVKGSSPSASVMSALSLLQKAQKNFTDISQPSSSLLDAAGRVRGAAVSVCDTVSALVDLSPSASTNEVQVRARLTAVTGRALDALSALSFSARGLLPSVLLCDKAIESVTQTVSDLDKAIAKPSSQPSADTVAYRSHCEEIGAMCVRLSETLSVSISSSKDTGSVAKEIADTVSSLAQQVSLASSSASTSTRSLELLRVAKKLSADLLETLMALRNTHSSPSSPSTEDIRVASQTASRSLSKLTNLIEADLLDLKEKEEEENDDRRAERELQKAAASIDRLAEKEKRLQTESSSSSPLSPVLDTTSSVTVCIASLLRAAVAAQRERVLARGAEKVTSALYRNDPTWANGLISAAQVRERKEREGEKREKRREEERRGARERRTREKRQKEFKRIKREKTNRPNLPILFCRLSLRQRAISSTSLTHSKQTNLSFSRVSRLSTPRPLSLSVRLVQSALILSQRHREHSNTLRRASQRPQRNSLQPQSISPRRQKRRKRSLRSPPLSPLLLLLPLPLLFIDRRLRS
jgi:hypothetical protein